MDVDNSRAINTMPRAIEWKLWKCHVFIFYFPSTRGCESERAHASESRCRATPLRTTCRVYAWKLSPYKLCVWCTLHMRIMRHQTLYLTRKPQCNLRRSLEYLESHWATCGVHLNSSRATEQLAAFTWIPQDTLSNLRRSHDWPKSPRNLQRFTRTDQEPT